MTLCQKRWHRAYSAAMRAARNAPKEQKRTVGIFQGMEAHWDEEKWGAPRKLKKGMYFCFPIELTHIMK